MGSRRLLLHSFSRTSCRCIMQCTIYSRDQIYSSGEAALLSTCIDILRPPPRERSKQLDGRILDRLRLRHQRMRSAACYWCTRSAGKAEAVYTLVAHTTFFSHHQKHHPRTWYPLMQAPELQCCRFFSKKSRPAG